MLRTEFSLGMILILLIGGTTDATADGPIIVSVNPAQNGLNTPPTASIEVTFDSDMDETSFSHSTFTVNASYSGRHFGTFAYDVPGRSVTFTPDRSFQVSEVVTVVLTTGIQSIGGEPLSQSYAWSFTIEVTNGLGVFDSLADYSIDEGDYNYRAMAAADFDNDYDIDLVVNKAGSLVILENMGDASFTLNTIEMPPEAGKAICAADFNNDGYVDVATTAPAILLNTGSGSFVIDSVYDNGEALFGVSFADFNNDGAGDLAFCGGGATWMYLNLGDGTLSPAVIYAGSGAGYMAVADFDNDWNLDLAVRGPEGITVLFNDGDGFFPENDVYPCGEYDAFSMCAADLESDGDMDILIASMSHPSLAVLINNGDGSFAEYLYIGDTESWMSDISAVDFDADGHLDIGVGNAPAFKPDRATVYFWWNNGSGGFVDYLDYDLGWEKSWSYVFADLDGDADIDIVMRDFSIGVVSVHLNLENAGECGDANSDGRINVADVVYLINYIFKGGPTPGPECTGDVNGDDLVNVADVVYLINRIFNDGPPPVEDCCLE